MVSLFNMSFAGNVWWTRERGHGSETSIGPPDQGGRCRKRLRRSHGRLALMQVKVSTGVAAAMCGMWGNVAGTGEMIMYRTILVCLKDPRHAAGLTKMGLALAARQGAHLVGLHVAPDPFVGMPTEVSVDYIERAQKQIEADAGAIEATFRDLAGTADVATEWRLELSRGDSYESAVTRHALCADLAITGQPDGAGWQGGNLLTDILLDTGRPVLFVPYAGSFEDAGNRALIAWNGGREAARAAFDAVPFLQQAQAVRVLTIGAPSGASAGLAPADDLTLALARHGVPAEAARTSSGDLSAGDTLLNAVSDYGADLLVMGCYGHSRFRQLLLGGVTRHILETMTVPVLMSR
ncbi:MAG TPA: universal stress protein [Aurantimonas sp.]|nr:universal stress protein [Aurantimonas sp.]